MILHIDMDAFFAAVEQKTDPRLRGKPVLVCGEPGTRSVVAAASYEARRFGISAGMPVGEAVRRCPHAVLVPGNPSKYVSLSLRVLELFKGYTPQVEPMSIDEAFLDLSGTPYVGRNSLQAAKNIQRQVRDRFDLGCSVGIAHNKLVAKMASGLQKPNGITYLSKSRFQEHFWKQKVDAMWGIGKETASALESMGITSLGQLAAAERGKLKKAFGINGPRLRLAARGEDDSRVIPYFEGVDNKSMGHEHTLVRDVSDPEALEGLLLRLADQVTRRLRREGYWGRVVVLKLRDSRFSTKMRQRALAEYTNELRPVFGIGKRLFQKAWNHKPLRLVGLFVSELLRYQASEPQLLFPEETQKRDFLRSVDQVRDLYGEESLLLAASMR